MINFKMTIDNVVVDNQYILDSIEFTTESGQQDYTVGSLFIPAVKTKLHNDVKIAYNSTVKIFLINEDSTEIPYGIFEPYEIKQSNLYRELTLYPQLYFTLTETYNPVQDTLTTRQLVQNMQLELGFLVENIDKLSIVDMHGLKADSAINLLKDIALVSATNIIINRSGKIEFKRITSNSTVYTINGSNITEITKSDTVPYQITQVVGKVDDNSETEEIVAGTYSNKWNTMTITNAHITQSIVNSIYTALSTVTYNGFELKIFNAPINLEVLDKIKFTYKDTNYTIPVMDLTIAYSRGGLVAKIKANVSTALDKTTSHKGSVTSRLEVIKNITQELNTKLDIQDGQIQSLISQTTIVEGDKEVSIKDKYSELTQDINGIKITVGSTETKINELESKIENNLSSYSILLSNENHVFPSDANGKITEEITVTTDVTVHKGMNEVAFTIGTLPTVNGFTLSKTDKTITITANVGTLMADSGTIEIPITVDGIAFTKTFSYAKAKAGADNQNISVIGDQVFKYSNNFTGTPTPEMITLSVIRNNITTKGKWQYLDENDIWTDYYQNNVLQTGDTINIYHNAKIFGTTDAKTMRVRYFISDDMKDEMTLVKISDGKNGQDGTTIVNIKEQYYLSTSQQTLINGSWQDTAPTWTSGKYIWTRTVFTYNNNTTSTTEPICVTGKDGADGLNGGVSVSNVDVFYYQSTSATSLQGGEWSTTAPTWTNGKYVWSKTITYLDNGTQTESQAVCISGEKGQDGNSAKLVTVTGEQVFKYSENFKGTPTPETIILKAIVLNTTEIGKWQYMETDGTWADYTKGGTLVTSKTIDILYNSKIFGTSDAKSMRLRYYISDTLYDEITLVKVSDGAKGTDGTDGIDGLPGKDGTSSYFYVRYSVNSNGNPMTTTPSTDTKYIGVCSTTSSTAPSSYSSYTWSKFIGEDGYVGRDGIDGTSSYLHIKYSNDGGKTFTSNNGEDLGSYIGTYVDTTSTDSSDVADYKWSKFVGTDGKDGIDGIDGEDGVSTYFYVRYSANADGSSMTSTPSSSSLYMGVCSTTSTTAPTSASSYQWTLIKGSDGKDGIAGADGTDGQTSYLHIKYSNDGKTFTDNNGEDLGKWIGTYVDFNETDSTSFSSYTWSKYVGEDGQDGADGTDGTDGYTIILTNEAQPIPTNTSRTPLSASTYSTDIIVYQGTTKRTDFTVGTISSANGITVAKPSNSKINFTVSTATALGADNGTFTIPITIDSKTFNKVFSWSCSKQGNKGEDGADAMAVSVTGEQVFKYTSNFTGTPTPETIPLTVTRINTTASGKWQYMDENSTWQDFTQSGTLQTGNTLNVSHNSKIFGTTSAKSMRVRYYISSTVYDEITLVKVSDGTNGTDGKDSYTVILTNENHSFLAGNSGNISTETSTTTKVYAYKGATSVGFTLGTITAPTGMTITNNIASGGRTITFTVATGTSLANSGTVDIPIVVDGTTYTKTFSWSKALKGTQGAKGDAGNDAYTVILTNENHTFNAEQNGNIPTAITTTTKVITYKGATSVTPTIGTLPSVGGLTITKASDGVTINIQANTGTSLATNGKFDIPITVDGKSFTKVFSWSKVNKGTNAYSASIGASSQVFKSMDGGQTYTPNTITLTPILQNLTYSAWQYSTNGGSSWNGFSSSVSGWSVSSGVLTINKDCSLFTNSISSITLKLVTNNSSYYDTVTVVKLNDVGELELGGRNYLLATSGITTIDGTNTSNQCTKMYGIVGGTDHALAGKQVTMSFEFSVSSGSTGTFKIQTNDTYASPATTGSWYALSDSINVANNSGGKITKTVTIPEDSAKRFSGIQVRMDNFTGSLTISKAKLEIGNIATDWSPAPEDGINYTDELVNDLREIDLQDLINLNNQAVSKIDSIIQDGTITPNEKVDLQAEFARIALLRGSTKDFYDTVNDTALSTLLNDMETTYENVKTLINPVISDMTTTSNASASEIRRAFIAFYEINQSLLTALQQSVAILSVNNSTSIETLETQISLTATKQTEYATKIDTVTSHLDFTQSGFVEIYATTNGTKGRFSTQITDQKLAFKDNGEEVAYISNQEMYITKATITDQMQIGNFIIKPSGTANGGIMFIHIDNA